MGKLRPNKLLFGFQNWNLSIALLPFIFINVVSNLFQNKKTGIAEAMPILSFSSELKVDKASYFEISSKL